MLPSSQQLPMMEAAFLSVYGGLVPLGFSHSNLPILCIYLSRILPQLFPNFNPKSSLKSRKSCATMVLLFGEAGVIPARARRRVVR